MPPPRTSTDIQIFVKNLVGNTITLDVSASDTVAAVKDLIQVRERIPPHLQRLTHAGSVLVDRRTLAQCCVRGEAMLWLSLRICGGGEKASYRIQVS